MIAKLPKKNMPDFEGEKRETGEAKCDWFWQVT